MKISSGTILEFLFAIFFLSVGINIGINITGITVITVSILAMIHCLYSWIKKATQKRSNTNEDNKKINAKPKKLYQIIVIVSIILNILLISVVIVISIKNIKIENNKKQYKKCVERIKYNTITTVNSFEKEDYTYGYVLSEIKWKELQKCAKKYKIKIETSE